MAQQPTVVQVAFDYRAQLERNEDEALRRMARYWVQIEQEIQPQLDALVAEIEQLKRNGQPISPQLIYSRNRYQSMMAQIQRELDGYSQTATDLISEYQRRDFLLGLDDANAIIKAAGPDSSIWTRVNVDAAEMVAGFAGNGAPLATLLRTDYGELGSKITDALISGVALGKGPDATARAMRDAMGFESKRWMRVARTEINRSYRLANAQQYAASGVVEKVLRLAYKPTACFACLEMDGEECPNGIVDDHPNGKCSSVVKTFHGKMPEWQTGHEWLMEQSEADQRRIMGDGRYEMWKKDGVSPRDMVEMRDNPVWGGSPSVISEKRLLKQLGGLE